MSTLKSKKALGIGSPLIDHLSQVSVEKVASYNLIHGGMKLVDGAEVSRIYDQLEKSATATGGSAANTILALSRVGGKAGFIGKVADDKWGQFFADALVKHGIENRMVKSAPGHATGRVISLVTPSGERSFATNLGAALTFSPDDLDPTLFKNTDLVYLEGYLIMNGPLIERIVSLAREHKTELAVDLASFNIVEEQRDAFWKLIKENRPIVFANEDEAFALTGKREEEALAEIAQHSPIAIVKIGERGSLASFNGANFQHSIKPVKAIDTTGAGDLYAAGFLHGYLLGLSTKKCMELGSLLSGEVVQVLGATLSETTWEKIAAQAKAIIDA